MKFRDAIAIVAPDKLAWYDAQDKDNKYQKECIALLDEAQARDDLAMVLQDEEDISDEWF